MRPTLTATDLFGSRGRVDVLRVLWGVDVPVTPAEVARRTGLTHPAATHVLRALSDEGLLGSAPAGRGRTYWLLKQNVYVTEMVEPLFAAERVIPNLMVDYLRDRLGQFTVSTVLFGSYARGEQNVDSDVDLVAVAEDGASMNELQAALDAAASEFGERFGAGLSALVYSLSEAATLVTRAPHLYAELWREGVTISGLGVDEWGADE